MPTVVRTASIPPRTTSWSDTVTLDQVDPAIDIQSLALSLTGSVTSTVDITNFDLVATAFRSTATGHVVLSRPDGSPWLSTVPVAFMSGMLPSAPDIRRIRFSGQGSATSTVGFIPAAIGSADAALLIGTGQVTFTVTASARIQATGPGNMEAWFRSVAGADVSLAYATRSDDGSTHGGGFQFVNVPYSASIWFAGGTKSQTLTAATAAIGAVSALSFDGFDPSLGVLDGVMLSITPGASGTAQLENLDPVAGAVTLGHTATLTLAGVDGRALLSSDATFSTTRQLAAFDGTDDLGGASATAFNETALVGSIPLTKTTIFGTGLGAFKSGSVALSVARTGSTVLDGPGNLHAATTLDAGAEVTLTYHYVDPILNFTNTATGLSGTAMADIYAGPVAGLQRQYI